VVLVLIMGSAAAWFLTRPDDERARDRADSQSSVASDPDDDDDEADDPDASPSSEESATSETSPSSEVSATAEPPSPSATSGGVRYRCWDGSKVDLLSDCSVPTGPEGLRYLFPSALDQKYVSCLEPMGKAGGGRVWLITCTPELSDGSTLLINYSQWKSVSAAIRHYDDKPGLTRLGETGGVISWKGTADDQVNSVGLYSSIPFSISVYAPSDAAMGEAFVKSVSARPIDELRGEVLD
jgi:hypothetical protein